MDKITSNVRRSQWLDIIHACNTSGLTWKSAASSGLEIPKSLLRFHRSSFIVCLTVLL